jgi:hypothetical protein
MARKKKKHVPREPNGRASRIHEERVNRRLALFQRRHLGVSLDEAMQPLYGYPLGVLTAKGVIDMRLHDAGVSYRSAFSRWRSLMGFPPLSFRTGHISRGGDPNDETVERAKERLSDADAVLHDCGVEVLSTVATVVIGDLPPPTLVAVIHLRVGLDALARHFRIPYSKQE